MAGIKLPVYMTLEMRMNDTVNKADLAIGGSHIIYCRLLCHKHPNWGFKKRDWKQSKQTAQMRPPKNWPK